jgi:methionine aminotransferase
MSNNPLIPQSKLPNLGTTIFTQMSALAQQHQAINLSQGFPDFDGPLFLQERLAYHVAHGANQYAPMTGVQRCAKPSRIKRQTCTATNPTRIVK